MDVISKFTPVLVNKSVSEAAPPPRIQYKIPMSVGKSSGSTLVRMDRADDDSARASGVRSSANVGDVMTMKRANLTN